MKEDYDVTLRGHHLMALYIFCFSGGEAKIWELTYFRYSYSEKTTKHLIKTLKKITKPDIRVKIVDSLDHICKGCESKKSSCDSTPKKARREAKIAEYIDLKVGKIYSSRYILRKLKKVDEKEFLKFYRQSANG